MKRSNYNANPLDYQNIIGMATSGVGYYNPTAGSTPQWMLNYCPEVVPENLVYNTPKRAPRLFRVEKRLDMTSGANYGTSSNKILPWDFPNLYPVDFRGGFIQIRVVLTKTGGTYIRLHQGAWSMFTRVIIRFGLMTDIVEYCYNRIYAYRWNSLVDPWRPSHHWL